MIGDSKSINFGLFIDFRSFPYALRFRISCLEFSATSSFGSIILNGQVNFDECVFGGELVDRYSAVAAMFCFKFQFESISFVFDIVCF